MLPDMPEHAPLTVDVLPADAAQAPIIDNLFQLYAHDFSDFADVPINADGRFVYPPLPLYWREPHRFPFLIRADAELAGFALVQRGSQLTGAADVWDVAEFFVLRAWRRHGVGALAADALWRRMAGSWEVRVGERNIAAQRFWQRAVQQHAGTCPPYIAVEHVGKRWLALSFVSRGTP
jgi:predicted acetyltransferase